MALYLKDYTTIISNLGIQNGGEAHAFLTSTCAKHMNKYVPFKIGNLSDYKTTTDEIRYEQAYATYQYFGRRKDGTHVINPNNRTRSRHPLATSFWAEKMITAEGSKVEQEVSDYIKKHGGG